MFHAGRRSGSSSISTAIGHEDIKRKRGIDQTYRIPGLDVDGPRALELAHQPLARGKAGNDAAARDAFERVLCVPGDKVTVVDNVLFSVGELCEGISRVSFLLPAPKGTTALRD